MTTGAGEDIEADLVSGTAARATDERGTTGAYLLDLSYRITAPQGNGASAGAVEVRGTLAGEGPGSGGSYAGEGAPER